MAKWDFTLVWFLKLFTIPHYFEPERAFIKPRGGKKVLGQNVPKYNNYEGQKKN